MFILLCDHAMVMVNLVNINDIFNKGVGVGCHNIMISLLICICHVVILYRFLLNESGGMQMHIRICSCKVGYAVTWFSIIWVLNCMVKSVQLHMLLCNILSWHCDNLILIHSPCILVQSVPLHIFLCNYVSWCCDNLVPTPKLWLIIWQLFRGGGGCWLFSQSDGDGNF